MKVVVCSTHVFWPSHCERDLELIQKHIDAGDEVTQLECRTDFDRCDFHMSLGPAPSEDAVRARCSTCIDRLSRSQRLVTDRWNVLRYEDLPEWSEPLAPPPPSFRDIDALEAFEQDGFNVGVGVASSLISHSRLTRPDMAGYQDIVQRAVGSALRVHRGFRVWLKRERPDIVYVFNGRFSHVHALFRACKREGIRCVIHESGSQITRYAVIENATMHDREAFARRAKAAWAAAGVDERRQAAEQWYRARAAGADQAWFSFVREHDPSLMPSGWVAGRPKLVVFTSSEDEFAALGPEWKNKLFARQSDGLRVLAEIVREVRPDADLVIRMHPGLTGVKDPEVEKTLSLEGDGVIVVPPESKVSTYRLLHECDVALSFGSTMGIEAVFWGKPSILLGPSMYKLLGGTYAPESIDALRAMLSEKLEPLDAEGALIFAYYLGSYGEPYRYYEPTGLLRGRYRGVDLDALPPKSMGDIISERAIEVHRFIRKGVRAAALALLGPSVAARALEYYRSVASHGSRNLK